jgi:hypothetical protein
MILPKYLLPNKPHYYWSLKVSDMTAKVDPTTGVLIFSFSDQLDYHVVIQMNIRSKMEQVGSNNKVTQVNQTT